MTLFNMILTENGIIALKVRSENIKKVIDTLQNKYRELMKSNRCDNYDRKKKRQSRVSESANSKDKRIRENNKEKNAIHAVSQKG